MKIKPESEIYCHITLTSVISGLFPLDIFTGVVCFFFGNLLCKVGENSLGAPHNPTYIIAAALTLLGRLH